MTLIPGDGSKTFRVAYTLIAVGLVVVAMVLAALNLRNEAPGSGAGAITNKVPLQTVTASGPTPIISFYGLSGEIVAIRHFETWSFEVYRIDDEIHGQIEYDKTEDGIQSYVETNRQFAKELAEHQGEHKVVITFEEPLPVRDLREWCRSKGLRVVTFNLIDPKDPEHSKLELSESLEFLDKYENPPNESPKYLFNMSATHIKAVVVSESLLQVALDPKVFLADVTTNIVQRELIAEGLATPEEFDGYFFGVDSPIYDRDQGGSLRP
jgi:hypothetical protein